MQTSLVCFGLVSAIMVVCVQAGPYPGPTPYAMPVPNPMAAPAPAAYPYPGPQPLPSCGGAGSSCGGGGPGCCGGLGCENGACYPITEYKQGFFGPPKVKGGYGATFSFGR